MSTTHTIRTANGAETVELTPIKAMRLKCLDCCAWQQSEVKRCTAKLCPLYPYRMGHRPESVLESDDFGDDGDSG